MNSKNKRLLVNLLILLVLSVGTTIAIQYAKGYRPNIQDRSIQGTGLLSLTSHPKDARVIINDRLTTVTDDKLYLTPGTYTIKIEKDGFHPWTKIVPIKPELVSSVDTRLFPLIPATTPITFYQVTNAVINPEGTKIVYVVSQSPLDSDNGLYIYSLTGNLLGSQNLQIAGSDRDYAKSMLVWSPDSSQILAVFTEKTKSGEKITSSNLLSTRSLNQTKTTADVTYRLPLIISEWQDQITTINQSTLTLYPKFMVDILTTQSINAYFSPDKEKVLYTPTQDLSLPENKIGQALPNINSTPETRNLTKGATYVYDTKEGTNYLIGQSIIQEDIAKTIITSGSATPSANLVSLKQIKAQADSHFTTNITWYGSRQLLIQENNAIKIMDYDAVNPVIVTNASIKDRFVTPSPDASKLILLTNINQKPDTFNLFAFDLK